MAAIKSPVADILRVLLCMLKCISSLTLQNVAVAWVISAVPQGVPCAAWSACHRSVLVPLIRQGNSLGLQLSSGAWWLERSHTYWSGKRCLLFQWPVAPHIWPHIQSLPCFLIILHNLIFFWQQTTLCYVNQPFAIMFTSTVWHYALLLPYSHLAFLPKRNKLIRPLSTPVVTFIDLPFVAVAILFLVLLKSKRTSYKRE